MFDERELTTMHSVFVDLCENIPDTIEKALDFAGMKDLVRSDMHVYVKPNFTFPVYKEGITTNPEVLHPLLGFLKNAASKVTVVESNGGNRSFTADDAFDGHDMKRLCADNGADLVNLSRTPWRQVSGVVNSKRVAVTLPALLLKESDLLVDVPVLKVHAMTRITLGLKNLWGCNPDTMRCLSHQDLDRKLVLMASLLNPALTLIDGTYALDNHGPMFGTPVRKDIIIAANNIVAGDSLGARIMGVAPRSIKHIKQAEDFGLGSTDLKEVRINKDWSEYVMDSSLSLTFVDRLSWIPFQNDYLARIIFQSPFSGTIRKVAEKLKTKGEKMDFSSYGSYWNETASSSSG